jgi:hypothetical protein
MRAQGARPRASRWATARARLLSPLRGATAGEDEENGPAEPPPAGGVNVPPPPPACPSGWHTGAPDFVGVGFQRCGTTRWYNLVTSHPEVDRPVAMKELHFFDRFHSGGATEQELAAYHEYFPRPAGKLVGEWTPLYASGPWIPPLLAGSAPQAKLLMIVRDPVERLISGLALDAAVAARQGMPLSRYAPLEAYMRGLYHAQISLLLRHFERSRLLVLQYERCVADPAAELRRTFAFLGLREDLSSAPLDAHPRRRDEKPDFDDHTRKAYVEAYSEDVGRLGEAFPEIDLGLWPNFAHLAG